MPGVPPARYAYLGPAGTFSEAALLTLPAAANGERQPHATVPEALDAVRRGEADAALVPFENSLEGSVTTTLDDLANGEPLQVTREVLLPVRFALLARPGTQLSEVARIITIPIAGAQCSAWLRRHLPEARLYPASSTASGAQLVAAGEPYDAAISAPNAAAAYRLAVLADDLGDNPDAVTRFVLVTRPGPPPAPTGADRTTLVAYEADDHPGALLEMLTEFAVRGVNLTRLESRPTGTGLGRYCFSMDCEGHIADARVGDTMSALRRICADVRFLGSYPRADGRPTTPRRGTTDADFRDGAAWVERIRDGRA
jgi:prephenate dehydratase